MSDTDCDYPNLNDYAAMVTAKTCRHCKAPLDMEIQCYPHDCGWPVAGFAEFQWLYIHCAGCGYDWSLWKLGVPR